MEGIGDQREINFRDKSTRMRSVILSIRRRRMTFLEELKNGNVEGSRDLTKCYNGRSIYKEFGGKLVELLE